MKSSYSNPDGNCVDIIPDVMSTHVAIYDSKNRQHTPIYLTKIEFKNFLDKVKRYDVRDK